MVRCPRCREADLELLHSLALGDDSRSDEIRFQVSRCSMCDLRALGACEESRRGALDSECVDHYAEPVSLEVWQRWRQLVLGCPQPEEERCGCCAHQSLRRYDGLGRWLGRRLYGESS